MQIVDRAISALMHHGGGPAAERNLLCQGYHRVLILHVLDGSSGIITRDTCTAIAFLRHFLVASVPAVAMPELLRIGLKRRHEVVTAQ